MEIDLNDNGVIGTDGKPVDKAREYLKIILKAQSEHREKGKTYFEKHHIIPKACGGTDAKNNIVLLTPEEHYICHALLPYIYTISKEHQAMIYAWNCLNNTRNLNINNSLKEKSLIYADLKKKFAKLSSISKQGNKHWNAKKIIQIDGETYKIIQKFDTIASAAKLIGADKSTLSRIIKKESIEKAKGFFWANEKSLKNILSIIKTRKIEKIYKLDPTTGKILEILTKNEAVTKYGLHEAIFTNVVRKINAKRSKKYCWANAKTLQETQLLIKNKGTPNTQNNHHSSKKLFCIDSKTLKILEVFEYAKQLKNKYPQFNYSNITLAARSTNLCIRHGYYWAYENTLLKIKGESNDDRS